MAGHDTAVISNYRGTTLRVKINWGPAKKSRKHRGRNRQRRLRKRPPICGSLPLKGSRQTGYIVKKSITAHKKRGIDKSRKK